jgi:hypothetical protein
VDDAEAASQAPKFAPSACHHRPRRCCLCEQGGELQNIVRIKGFKVTINWYRTLEEVRLEVNIKNVSAQTLDRVIKQKNVHIPAVFNLEALVYVDEVPELYAQAVVGHLIHLDSALCHVI